MNKSWTKQEFEGMVKIAKELNRPEIARAISAGYYFGMTLRQVVGYRRHYAERALREGKILILGRTQSSKPHVVPLNSFTRQFLKDCIKGVPRGSFVFCPDNTDIYTFKKKIEDFILHHREKVQDANRAKSAHNLLPDEKSPLTFEGLSLTTISNDNPNNKLKVLKLLNIDQLPKIDAELHSDMNYCDKGPLLINDPYLVDEVLFDYPLEICITTTINNERQKPVYVYADELELEPIGDGIEDDFTDCRFDWGISLGLKKSRKDKDMLEVGKQLNLNFAWNKKSYAIIDWPLLSIFVDGSQSGKIIEIKPFTVRLENNYNDAQNFTHSDIKNKVFETIIRKARDFASKKELLELNLEQLAYKLELTNRELETILNQLDNERLIYTRPGNKKGTLFLMNYYLE